MRAFSLLSVALILGALALPSASASFQLGAERIVERALHPGSDVLLPMPIVVTQDGFLYVKLLVTNGNAVNDGIRVNGSVDDATGWRVSFAMVMPDGSREELGTYVDSTPTRLVPVSRGDGVVLESVLHVPADAARGGPVQRAYIAIAYRASAATDTGGQSGAMRDDARAVTLLLTNALLPPAVAGEPEGPGTGGAEGSGEDENNIPPVGEIPFESTTGATTVIVQSVPAWFLVGALVLGALVVAGLFRGIMLLARIEAHLTPRPPASDQRHPREVPVAVGAAREFLAALESSRPPRPKE